MNFALTQLPERTPKPRNNGITMVMDKGLSLSEARNLIEGSAEFIDIIKLGFGSSIITPLLDQKIKTYQDAGIPVYFGGTLLEAFIVRNQVDDYCRYIDKYNITHLEVSDGSIVMPHDEKCELIQSLAKKYTVISEVGSKEEGIIIHPNKWIEMMNEELKAGSWKVIAESRESGTVGIYRASGKAHTVLVHKIISKVPTEHIIWEAPQKNQQTWFIKLLGTNANLGNIAPNEVIPLECLRLGLRSDTFFDFLTAENIPYSK